MRQVRKFFVYILEKAETPREMRRSFSPQRTGERRPRPDSPDSASILSVRNKNGSLQRPGCALDRVRREAHHGAGDMPGEAVILKDPLGEDVGLARHVGDVERCRLGRDRNQRRAVHRRAVGGESQRPAGDEQADEHRDHAAKQYGCELNHSTAFIGGKRPGLELVRRLRDVEDKLGRRLGALIIAFGGLIALWPVPAFARRRAVARAGAGRRTSPAVAARETA